MIVTQQDILDGFITFNEKYFSGELEIPKAKVNNSYKHIGRFYCRFNRKGRVIKPTIEMSKCYDFTKKQFRDILVHEMIHYYLMWNGEDVNGTHGEAFLGMAEMFNKKFKLNITPTIDMTDYVLSPGKTLFMYKLRMMMPF